MKIESGKGGIEGGKKNEGRGREGVVCRAAVSDGEGDRDGCEGSGLL